jgi:hypothetical protein
VMPSIAGRTPRRAATSPATSYQLACPSFTQW